MVGDVTATSVILFVVDLAEKYAIASEVSCVNLSFASV
jgi:hypothetical protein